MVVVVDAVQTNAQKIYWFSHGRGSRRRLSSCFHVIELCVKTTAWCDACGMTVCSAKTRRE